MPSTLTPDEVVERGEAIYTARLGSELEPAHLGEYVVIDVDSGEYQVGPEYYPLTKAMLANNSKAVLCILKIGYPAAVSVGGRLRPIRQ